MAPELDLKPRKFWYYIKSKSCDSVGVSPLRCEEGYVYTYERSKANILNRQFKSAFNTENGEPIPALRASNIPHFGPITVNREVV